MEAHEEEPIESTNCSLVCSSSSGITNLVPYTLTLLRLDHLQFLARLV